MNNDENYARYFILFTIFVLVLFFGYKYYEYKTIKDFVTFQNKSEDQEYRFVEKSNQVSGKYGEMVSTFFGVGESVTPKKTKKTDMEIYSDSYDLSKDILNLGSVITEADKDYSNLIKNNLKKYNESNKKFSIILGSQGKLFRDFIHFQQNYYDDEIQNSIENIVGDEFMQNYVQVLQDRLTLTYFEKITKGKTKDFISNNLGIITQLEKYTRSDYKFIDEDTIKAKRPYGFELLDKNRKYMAAYYELIKEYIFGDLESYKYKYEKFNTISSDFNIDMNKVFSEGDSENIGKGKKIMENIYGKFLVGKKLNNILNKPTIFGKYGVLNSDTSMCQSYSYRYNMFNIINDKYPSSKNIDELISQLDSVNLSNKEADKLFNKSLLIYTDLEDKATFECTDQNTKEKYIFSNNK